MNTFIRWFFALSILVGPFIRLTPAPGISLYVHDIAVLCCIVWWVWRVPHKTASRYGLTGPVLVWSASMALSLLVRTGTYPLAEFMAGTMYAVRYLLYVFMYAVVRDDDAPVAWLRTLFATGTLFAVFGIIQFFLYPDLRNLAYLGWDPHYYRLFSTQLDPNYAALLLVFTIIIGVWLAQSAMERIWIWVGTAVSSLALLLTFSRSGYLAFVAASLVAAIAFKRYRYLLATAAFVAIVVLMPKPAGLTHELTRAFTAVARLENWRDTAYLGLRSPVFGHGFNLLRSIRDPGFGGGDGTGLSHAAAGADNGLLFIFATTGIIGSAAYVALSVRLWMMGMGARGVRQTRSLGVAWLCTLAAWWVHGMFANSLVYPWALLWIWPVAGAVERMGERRVTSNR